MQDNFDKLLSSVIFSMSCAFIINYIVYIDYKVYVFAVYASHTSHDL